MKITHPPELKPSMRLCEFPETGMTLFLEIFHIRSRNKYTFKYKTSLLLEKPPILPLLKCMLVDGVVAPAEVIQGERRSGRPDF